MIGALLYLRFTSLKNRLLSRVRRLRQPKYLMGALVGAAYFWFIFFRPMGRKSTAPHLPEGQPFPGEIGADSPLLLAAGSALLFLAAVLTWVLPKDKPGLRFSEAETAFLFPAPVSRRMLINFKLLGAQFSILFTSLLFTLIFNRSSFSDGNAFTRAIAWWVILSTLNLHFTGAALTVTRLIDEGVSTLRRRAIILGGVAVVAVATIAWVWGELQAPLTGGLAGTDPISHSLQTVLTGGALGWLLWPFRLVLAPFFASGGSGFWVALLPALLLMAAHYYWVMRLEVSFEEASLADAQKRTALIAQVQAGKYQLGQAQAKARPGPFHLADTGRPYWAFLWKNLLSTRSYFNLRTFAVLAAIIVVGSRWIPRDDATAPIVQIIVTATSGFAAVYILFLGPHLARQDLRSDLANADILKTYPIRGWQLLLGELLTPIAILSALIWLAVLAPAVVVTPPPELAKTITPVLQATCAICIAVVVPPIIALQLLVLNGATLLFPAWIQPSRQQAGGIELMGQRIIFALGTLLVVLTALLPAGASAALLIFVTQWIIGLPAALILATLVVVAVLVGEVWCGLWWLGERFEKFDLSAELRP